MRVRQMHQLICGISGLYFLSWGFYVAWHKISTFEVDTYTLLSLLQPDCKNCLNPFLNDARIPKSGNARTTEDMFLDHVIERSGGNSVLRREFNISQVSALMLIRMTS